MIGVVLGLGFQLWPEVKEPWQFLAFVFVYMDIVDYWIDYGPALKKFPPKREIDVLLDVAIMFSLFLYIYATQLNIFYFFCAFILIRILDYFWLFSSKHEYNPVGTDRVFVDTWLEFDLIEIVLTAGIALLAFFSTLSPLALLLGYIAFRIIVRILASRRYKRIHFA